MVDKKYVDNTKEFDDFCVANFPEVNHKKLTEANYALNQYSTEQMEKLGDGEECRQSIGEAIKLDFVGKGDDNKKEGYFMISYDFDSIVKKIKTGDDIEVVTS